MTTTTYDRAQLHNHSTSQAVGYSQCILNCIVVGMLFPDLEWPWAGVPAIHDVSCYYEKYGSRH